jgi:hypothetical protein
MPHLAKHILRWLYLLLLGFSIISFVLLNGLLYSCSFGNFRLFPYPLNFLIPFSTPLPFPRIATFTSLRYSLYVISVTLIVSYAGNRWRIPRKKNSIAGGLMPFLGPLRCILAGIPGTPKPLDPPQIRYYVTRIPLARNCRACLNWKANRLHDKT